MSGSNVIDEKVVSMQFDNRQFEENVSKSIGSIDKLKSSLNFDKTNAQLQSLDKAAKSVNFNELEITATKAGFHISDVWQKVSTTFEYKIANRIVSSATRIAKALTITPVKTGMDEYEMKLGSVRTIVNSTHEPLKKVNKLLEELNTYSDRTIYSFRDMTSNIGKFTNSGVKLKSAVAAIKGISNEAAISGATANEASRAMYNFAQALSSGYVKLIDWKSIENANMATVAFKKELLKTALAMGTVTKKGNMYVTTTKNAQGSISDAFNATKGFNDALSHQWMTSKVLVKTLKRYTDESTKLGRSAYKAASEVTNLHQMWDVLQETAQSGWAKTWELIFGDLNHAKKIFSPLTDALSKVIGKFDDWRNLLLEKTLNNPFTGMIKSVKAVYKGVYSAEKSVKQLGKSVKKIANHEMNHGTKSIKQLTLSGHNWHKLQKKVNKELGVQLKHAKKKKNADKVEQENNRRTIIALSKLSTARMKHFGLSKKEISALKVLQKESKASGVAINRILKNPDILSGRSLLVDSFRLVGKAMGTTANTATKAYKKMMPKIDPLKIYKGIERFRKNVEHIFDPFIKDGKKTTKEIKQLTRIFKGLFAVVDMIRGTINSGLQIAFRVIRTVFKNFNIDILEVLANVGDAIVGFRKWFNQLKIVDDIVSGLSDGIVFLVKKIMQFVNFIGNLEISSVAWLFEGVKNIFSALGIAYDKASMTVGDAFNAIKEHVTKGFADMGPNFIQGFINGVVSKAKDGYAAIRNFFVYLLEAAKNILGIHSPSTETAEIGSNFVSTIASGIADEAVNIKNDVTDTLSDIANGIFGTIQNILLGLWEKVVSVIKFLKMDGLVDALKTLFGTVWDKVLDIIQNINIGDLIKSVMSIVMLKLADGMAALSKGLGSLFNNIGLLVGTVAKQMSVLGSKLGKFLAAKKWEARAKAIESFAKALAILVGTFIVLAYAIKKIDDPEAFITAGVIIAAMTGFAIGVAVALSKIKDMSIKSVLSAVALFIAVSVVLSITSKAMERLSNISNPAETLALFAGIIAGLYVLIGKLTDLAETGIFKAITKIGKIARSMAVTFALVAIAMKIMEHTKTSGIAKGIFVVSALTGIMMGLAIITSRFGTASEGTAEVIKSFGKSILFIAIAMKIFEHIKSSAIGKGLFVIGAMTVMYALLIKMVQSSKTISDNAADVISKFARSLNWIATAMAILALIPGGSLAKGVAVMAAFGVIVRELIRVSSEDGSDAWKTSAIMFSIAGALSALAIVAVIVGMIDLGTLTKGLLVLGVIGGLLYVLIDRLSKIKDVKQTKILLMSLAGMMLIMSGLLIYLSTIDTGKMAAATAAITIMMGTIALLLYMVSKVFDSKTSQNALALPGKQMGKFELVIGAVAALLALMAGIIFVLLQMPNAADAVPAALGVALLSGALFLMVQALSKINIKATALKDIGVAVLGMLMLCVPILALAAILTMLKDTNNAIKNAIALAGLVTVLTAVLFALTGLGAILVYSGGTAILGLVAAIVALAALIVVMKQVVDVLRAMGDIQNAAKNSKALTTMMLALSLLLTVCAVVGPLALIGIVAIKALVDVITAVGILAVGIGVLMEKFPQLNTFLDTGIDVLIKIAEGIGKVIGSFVANVVTTITGTLPTIGKQLSQFYENAKPFIEGMRQIGNDNSVYEGVKTIALALLYLIGAKVLDSITSFIGFAGSFETLGTKLSNFYTNASTFINGMTKLKPHAMDATESLANAILSMTKSKLLDAIGEFLGADVDFDKFGTDVASLGAGLASFAESVSGLDDSSVDHALIAAKVVKVLAQAAADIPETGGIIQAIAGETDINKFGADLVSLGKGIASYARATGQLSENQLDRAKVAGDVIGSLTSATKDMPESGLMQSIFGKTDVGKFGNQLRTLGDGLNAYATKTDAFSNDTKDKCINAGEVLTSLVDAAKGVSDADGWFDDDIDDFGEMLPDVGDSLSQFNDKVKDLDATKMLGAASAFFRMAESARTASGANMDNFWAIKDNAEGIGQAIATLVNELSDITDTKINDTVEKMSCASVIFKYVSKLVPDTDIKAKGFKIIANQVPKIADAIKIFINKTKNIKLKAIKLSSERVEGMTKIISVMNKIAKVVKTVQSLDTEKMQTFITNIPNLSTAMNGFIKGLKKVSSKEINASVEKLNNTKKIVNVVNVATKAFDKFDAINDQKVTAFASAMPALAKTMNKFVNSTSSIFSGKKKIGEKQLEKFAKLAKSAGIISKAIASFSAVSLVDRSSFNTTYSEMCETMKTFITDMGDIGKKKVDKAYKNINMMVKMVKKLDGLSADTVERVSTAMKDISKSANKSFFNGFVSEGSETKAVNTITTVIGFMSNAVAGEDITKKLNTTGYNIAVGLANGMTSKESKAKVRSAGSELGTAAINGTKTKTKVKSPSRVFMRIGEYLGEGLAIGINNSEEIVSDAASKMGLTGINAVREGMSTIYDVLNSDMELSPIISPVLDMSNVEAGSKRIGDLFSLRGTIGNVRGISTVSSIMANRQNGNEEVLMALKDIKNSQQPVNNYTINGVTYDDGTNVANAVGALINAVNIERRM